MSPVFIILCSVIGLTSGTGVLPDSVNAAVGDAVTFTTILPPTETAFVNIAWGFKGANVITHSASTNATSAQYEGRITLFISTGSLELRNLAPSDAGDYSVTITPAGGGAPETGSTTLNIYERVSNVSVTASDTVLVEFNDTVTLSCSASGSSLTFVWFNGSAEIKPSDRVNFTNGGANVTFDPVLRYDEGSYSCNVSDPVSSSTSDKIRLSVSYGPDFAILESSPSGEHHEAGFSIYMECLTDSEPGLPQFTYFRDEEKLSTTVLGLPLFFIKEEDSGNYSCEAYNSRTHRKIRSQPLPITVWDSIKNPVVQSSKEPVEGSSVNLTCEASGSILTREWKLDDVELKPSGNIQFYDEKRVLSFRNLTRKDNGIFTCNISNPVSSRTADYTMKANYGPENVRLSGSVELVEGGTLTLSCAADSEPKPLYTWTKSGINLVESNQYVKRKVRVSDGGEYVCQATNKITMKTSQGSIKVVVAPSNTLSAGAIAGIAIATVVVVGGAAAGGFFLYKRK